MTLEEAQARILELETQNAALESERDTLSQNNAQLTTDLENARNLNQQLFDRLPVGKKDEQEEQEPETPPTCEEFAKTINLF